MKRRRETTPFFKHPDFIKGSILGIITGTIIWFLQEIVMDDWDNDKDRGWFKCIICGVMYLGGIEHSKICYTCVTPNSTHSERKENDQED